MVCLNPNLPVTTLNVNGLNTLIKTRHLGWRGETIGMHPLSPLPIYPSTVWNVGVMTGTAAVIVDHADESHTLGVVEKKSGRNLGP